MEMWNLWEVFRVQLNLCPWEFVAECCSCNKAAGISNIYDGNQNFIDWMQWTFKNRHCSPWSSKVKILWHPTHWIFKTFCFFFFSIGNTQMKEATLARGFREWTELRNECNVKERQLYSSVVNLLLCSKFLPSHCIDHLLSVIFFSNIVHLLFRFIC